MKPKRMQRKRRAVPLRVELALEIDKLVGKKNRSAWATEIVEREICRLQQLPASGKDVADNQEPV